MQDTQLRSFSEWITNHARGTVDDELTIALSGVVEAVANHGKKGSLTLKIDVDNAGSGGRTVTTSCTVTAKPPTSDAEQSIFFVGDAGSLHRDDPYQQRLDVGDVRRVDAETGEIIRLNTKDND